jgi:hypothetical protein
MDSVVFSQVPMMDGAVAAGAGSLLLLQFIKANTKKMETTDGTNFLMEQEFVSSKIAIITKVGIHLRPETFAVQWMRS